MRIEVEYHSCNHKDKVEKKSEEMQFKKYTTYHQVAGLYRRLFIYSNSNKLKIPISWWWNSPITQIHCHRRTKSPGVCHRPTAMRYQRPLNHKEKNTFHKRPNYPIMPLNKLGIYFTTTQKSQCISTWNVRQVRTLFCFIAAHDRLLEVRKIL